MTNTNPIVAICSGGMDSVTLAHDLHAQYPLYPLKLLSFDYGQRHSKELLYARQCAIDLGADWHLVDLTSLTHLLGGSSLTDPKIEVPLGHYTAETMKATVVPNRNAIMLSIAWGYAVSINARFVATAVHAGDHAIYPDCRPEFIDHLNTALTVGNEGFGYAHLHLRDPYVEMTKADICKLGSVLGVDYTKTWSCYQGKAVHCGKCGTCVERKEAFQLNNLIDPTVYADA